MPGRGSIARLMVATALIGIDLGLIRTWVGPAVILVEFGAFDLSGRVVHLPSSRSAKLLGEFGPIAAFSLPVLAVAMVSEGGPRRFCLGAAATLFLTSTGFFLAPSAFRHAVYDQVVQPVRVHISYSVWPDDFLTCTSEERDMLWAHFVNGHQRSGPFRCPILTSDDQVALSLAQMAPALLAGLLAAKWRQAKIAPAEPIATGRS